MDTFFLQEFDLEIKDKKGVKNVGADLLSIIPNAPTETIPINENLPWYADIANYLATRQIPSNWSG